MAHVSGIWFHGYNRADGTMRVNVALKPTGTVDIDVKLPEQFHRAIMDIAQTAADNHEALMRAEILADQPQQKTEE